MNPVRKWRRILFVGCSHGAQLPPENEAAILKFIKNFAPHDRVHLGDFIDLGAFRSGAKDSEMTDRVQPDCEAGLSFLEKIKATHILCGNHEARVFRELNSSNAVRSFAASQVVGAINDTAKRLKANLVPYTGVWQGLKFGNYLATHGTMYSESATRDHAEAYGNIVHAHTHRAAVAKGRRIDNPTGFCVGTLADIPCMDYASTRRSTLSWSSGFVWGEYSGTETVLWLHEQPRGLKEWRLPV